MPEYVKDVKDQRSVHITFDHSLGRRQRTVCGLMGTTLEHAKTHPSAYHEERVWGIAISGLDDPALCPECKEKGIPLIVAFALQG